MARRPVSDRDLQREITQRWVGLQRARLDGNAARITGMERLMNEALDELADRIRPQPDRLSLSAT